MKEVCLDISGKVLYDMLIHYDHNIMINDVASNINTVITFADSQYRVVEGQDSAVVKFV